MLTLETTPVPLTVFGGAVTEMAPEDLPEGASPFSQDADFLPGSVFTRAGRENVYSFGALFAEDLAGVAVSVPGAHAPNETPWAAPTNATRNIPGTYSSVTLNFSVPGGGAVPSLDGTPVTAGLSSTIINPGVISITGAPSTAGEWALFASSSDTSDSPAPPPTGFTAIAPNNSHDNQAFQLLSGTGSINPTLTTAGATVWSAILAFFFTNGLTPAIVQTANSVMTGAATDVVAFGSNLNPANVAMVIASGRLNAASAQALTCTDTQGNIWTQISQVYTNGQAGFNRSEQITIWVATGTHAAADTVTVGGLLAFDTGIVTVVEVSNLAPGATTPGFSQVLKASNFSFNIPASEAILGVQLEVFGKQSVSTAPIPDPAGAIISGFLQLPDGTVSITGKIDQLPLADGQVTLGLPSESWALPLTPAVVNNPNFSARIVASSPVLATFSIYAIKMKVFTSSGAGANFNFIKSYEQASGQLDTLALDANGVLWDENVTATPGTLNSISTSVNPGSFAKSVTFENVEYLAFSNLLAGTDIPRHWDGTNLDRVSQVGPGAPPSVNATSTIFGIAPSPNGVTQNPPVTHDLETTGLRAVLWSAGPGNTSTGNVITVYYSRVNFGLAAPDPNIVVGQGIQIQGIPFLNGNASQPVNGNYIVTSTGSGIPPNGNFSNPHWYFTVQAATSTNGIQFTPGSGIPGSSYQVTLATLRTLIPLPNVQIGSQVTLAGVGLAAWNAAWTVLGTPNAGQLAITQTQLSNNVATYTFTLITGVAPTVGQQVTIVGCLNGPLVGGSSIFNISNGIVASVGANQFSINITAANVLPAAETANANVNGTVFTFDPGIQLAGQTVTNPIFGNSGGGTVVIGGVGLAAGVRKAVLLNLTRNGLITPASPPVIFNTTGATTSLAFSNIWPGPPDTVARIIAMTGANGGNFFWIPQPVIVQSNGQNVTYSSSVVPDNVSTQVVLTFTDAVLLSGTAIDILGNNLFNQMELGSCRGFLTYASRLIAWGEQNKIQNLLNLSFDGNIGTGSGSSTYPVGWTVDPVNGAGGNLRVSPIFGNSYYVQNLTGAVPAFYGMIEQSAFQDAYQVPIVLPNTKYSVRLSARCPSGVQTGSLVADLFSPLQNRVFGSFSVPLSSMTTNFQIFSGTMLTTTFAAIPPDLLFRVYFANLPNNGDGEIDRVEPFPTREPVFSTQFRASYANNQEAFDLVTGAFGPAQNQQPINGGIVLFDSLYALKEKSMFSTSDNGLTEPFEWNWRPVSDKVGTIGQNSYDSGEGWLLTACRPGVYFFEGGEPIKILQEIQPVWDLINWKYGHTIWLRNDEQLKRITIGVPIPTPNAFMPEMPVNANPTTPNVVLMCSYRELSTGIELAHVGPIRSSFSGRLLSPEPARKWSFWNISCPYADFIDRGNNQWPEFFCTGYNDSKVFQLNPAQLSDDGAAINSFYVTYGFVKPEMAEAKGLGLFRMSLDFLTLLATGTGTLNTLVYPESPTNPLPFVLDTTPLPAFSQGDIEIGALATGNRFFIRVGTNAVGAGFRLSKVVAGLRPDPWAPVSGTAIGSV